MSRFTSLSSVRRFWIAASMRSQEYSSEVAEVEGGPGMKAPRISRRPRDRPMRRRGPVRAALAIEILPEAELLVPLNKVRSDGGRIRNQDRSARRARGGGCGAESARGRTPSASGDAVLGVGRERAGRGDAVVADLGGERG